MLVKYFICTIFAIRVNQIAILKEHTLSDLEIVTHKSLATIFKCSSRQGSYFIKNTRLCYNKPSGALTLGQVLKANNLEK